MNKLNSLCVGLFSIFSSVALGEISISPGGPYSASAGFGQTSTVNLTVSNDASSPAVKVAEVFEDDTTGDLADSLTSLNEDKNDILATLTDRYLFRDGVTGTGISDGGGDMYDGGNYLRFGSDTNPPLAYSDNVVTDSADGSVSYFTRKYDGLFVLAADYKAHTSFHITGNLGADGSGLVALREFAAGYGYRAFVKTVWSAYDPSVNHLILVPDGGSLVRTSPSTTHYDTHSITGLEPNGRLYHLLFAKQGGAQFPISEIEALAEAFLRSVRVGPSWFSFPQNEVVNTGASRVLPVTLDARGLEPGVYTTRFTIDEQGTRSEDLPASAFHDLSFTVGTPSFAPAQNDLNVVGLEGVNPESMTMDLTPASSGTLLGTLQISSDESWVTVTRVPGENRVIFTYDTSSLAVGEYFADVTVIQGTTTQVVSLHLTVSQLNVVKLLPDPTRAKIYGINQDGKNRGSLLVIDTATQTIERNIPLGLQPSDMDLTEGAAELLVLNAFDPSIFKIDLSTLTVVAEYALTEFEMRDNFVTGHVADGPGDVVYYLDEQWGPRLRVFDTSTETVLQTFGSVSDVTPNTSGDWGYGGIKATSDRSKIYGWRLSRYNAGTHIVEFSIQADGTLTDFVRGENHYESNFRSTPYDSPVLLTGDGSHLVIKDRVIDQTDLDVHPVIYPDEIYTISSGGEIASGANAIYAGESGHVMHEFSRAVPVQAITPDNSTLVSFNSSTRSLDWLNLNTILGTSGLSLTPTIGDGAHVIGVDQTLSWEGEANALSYHVYFGTSEAAVMNADSSSPEYLGSLTGNVWTGSLPPLSLGSEYFWRVDIVGLNDGQKGDVWSFNVSPIMVTPIERAVHAPIGSPIPNQTHQLSSASPLSWTASSTTPWISVVTTSGTTDGTLTYGFNPLALSAGTYTGAIQITSGGATFDLPVTLVLHRLNLVHMQNVPSAGSVLALSNTPQAEGPSFLLDVNAATGDVTRFIEAGVNATDFDVATNQNRIYIANYGQGKIPVVDLDDWSHLEPLDLSSNVGIRYIEATPDGLLVLEQTSNYRTLIYNPSEMSAPTLHNLGSYHDHGKLSPDGNIYYQRLSYDVLGAYRIEGDSFERINFSGSLPGGQDLILSDDGSRLFTVKSMLTAEFEVVAAIPQDVTATDSRGLIAVGTTGVYWAKSGHLIDTLSQYSTAQAISSDDQYLVRYLASSSRFESVRVDSMVKLPGVVPQPGEVLNTPPTELSVPPVDGALGYQLFMGTSPSNMRLMMTQTSPQFSLTDPLSSHSYYYWRVDAGSPSGRIVGDVHSFSTVMQSSLVESAVEQVSYVGFQDRKLLTGRTGYGYYKLNAYNFDHETGNEDYLTSARRVGLYTSSSPYGSSVVMAGGSVYTIDTEGLVRVSQNEHGYWSQSDPIPVESSPSQIRGLRADGDLLFVSADGTSVGAYNKRIHIYRTFPELVLEHTIEVPTSESLRDFGSTFEVSGDYLVVSSKSQVYPQAPKLWIYQRDLNTGSWQLSDEETFPDASYSTGISMLATDGKSIAFSYTGGGIKKVAIFQEQSPGRFSRETTISADDLSSAVSYYFPSSLSLDQDYLIIGDRSASSLPGASGVMHVAKRINGEWQHLPSLMINWRTQVGYRSSVADGWLVADHATTSAQPHALSLFHLDAQANRRPLISSARPFQIVEGRQFSQTITVSDDDSVSMFLDQAPAWLSVNRLGGGFELSGMVPDSLVGDKTVRLRVTDSHGVSSYQTFDLVALESDDVPVIVTLPDSEELGVGESLTLRPVVSGTGPFIWRWFKDGVEIEGATGSRLPLDSLHLDDSGVYHFEVSNAVSTTTSDDITIQVRPANRFAGNWPMFGNGPSHQGHHPATFGTHRFFPAWSVSFESVRALNRVAVADDKVFVTPYSYYDGQNQARALSLTTGDELWQMEFGNTYPPNPPSYHNGRLYIQNGRSSGARVLSVEADTGVVAWATTHGSQSERYESPTVTDDGVWVNGGTYGGMYGFDLSGTQRFFERLPQISGWTPTVDNGRLYSWVGGDFKEHNPYSGLEIWSLDLGYGGGQNISAVIGNTAVVCSGTEMICIDLRTQEVRWRVEGVFNYVPAVMGDYAYAISDSSVVSYRLADGVAGVSYTSPSPILSRQPLLVNDHLFVASETETYVFELGNEDPIQVLPTGGLLSYSQGYLLTAANDGTLSAYFANDVPDFEDQVLADATEDIFYSQALQIVHDDDAEALTFTLLSGPSWISLTPEGVLEGTLRHTQGGVQTVRVQVSDGVTDPVVKEYVFNGIEVNDRPESTPLQVIVDEDAPEFFITLGDYFEDEETLDADLDHEIVQNDNTTLLSAALTNDQRMSINCLKDEYGKAVITVKGTDAGGLSVQTTVTITVNPVNDRPVFTADLPDIATDDTGAPRGLDVAPYVFDADPDDSLFYEIVGNTNPSIFGSGAIGGLSGKLQMFFAPYVSGVSDLTIRVTDLEGEYSEQVIRVTLPALPLPGLVAGEIQMNRQTGMYSQVVTVTNNGSRAIGGFLLHVNGLVDGYQVYGMPGDIVRYLTPVAPGESRTFTLEYYSTSSGAMPTPEFELELAQPEGQESPQTLGVIIEQVYVLEDRSVLLEFVTVPGKRYSIQYTDDMVSWHTSGVTVTAAANRTQWLDQGLPRTQCHPSECTSRLYRVLELEDE